MSRGSWAQLDILFSYYIDENIIYKEHKIALK